MNKTEREYADRLTLAGKEWRYEELTLKLAPDCRLTVDFLVLGGDDVVELHEVKGGWIMDDAKVKLRVAAARFPFFRFILAQKQPKKRGGNWEIAEVPCE